MKYITKENVAILLILVVVMSRLIPHAPNFTPVISIALFAGATFDSRWKAFLIPIAGLLISNIFLGFHPITWFVVAIMAGLVGFGFLMKGKVTPMRWIGFSLASPLVFFVLSNFSVWLLGELYPMTWEGLMTSYVMALPFLKYTVLSTLMYSLILFEGHRLLALGTDRLLKPKTAA